MISKCILQYLQNKEKEEMEFTKSERVVRDGEKDEGKPHYSTQRNWFLPR